MNTQENNNKTTSFPLRDAYKYLSDNGYDAEVSEIRESQDTYRSYFKSSCRKAKVIHLLDEKDLMDKFLEQFWISGKTQKGITRLNRLRRLYEKLMYENEEEEGEAEEEFNEGTSFAYEEDLKNYLSENLPIIEAGLKLYEGEDGRNGIEYSVDTNHKRVDILAIDTKDVPVVIELKVSRGYEKVIGQTLYYKSRIKNIFNTDKVRMIIIAREITEQLKLATEDITDVELFEYNLSIKLDKVS